MGKRLRAQRKGRGTVFRAPSHRYLCDARYRNVRRISGKVIDIVHDPGRTAPLVKVRYEDGKVDYCVAAEGVCVGKEMAMGATIPIQPGNILPLSEIPEGTPIFNIEGTPGDGGKYVRAAGTTAMIVSQGTRTVVQLPSGQFKSLSPQNRATIGVAGGGGRREKPIAKAGKHKHILSSKAQKWPVVSGVAMSPYNHPHGGGSHQHVGGPNTQSRNAPPGKKVGRFSPQRKKK
jgi:large subunit ribosomal protein L2